MIRIALIGNPNVGKSTLFNLLTGSNQHIGNWPGKTVEIAWGDTEVGGLKLRFVDLPGTYSIRGEDDAEKVVEEYLKTRPELVLVVADASQLHQSLYPLIQVLELGFRAVLVINMLDEAEKLGIKIDLSGLSKELGIPVVGTVARAGIGKEDVFKAVLEALKTKPRKLPKMSAEERHRFIEKILKKHVKGRPKRKEGIDKFLFTPVADLSLFLFTFAVLFYPTFTLAPKVSDFIVGLLPELNPAVFSVLEAVLSFLPLIFVFFFIFTALEDSGILARVAASFDRLLPLPGRAFFPVLMSFGCNAIAVPATRIMRDKEYRRAIVLALPFIPCSTRISVLIAFLSFFRSLAFPLAFFFLLISLFSAFLTARIFARRKKPPLVIELPPLRLPSLKVVLRISWLRTWSFFKKIFIWIFAGALVGSYYPLFLPELSKSGKIALSLILGFFAKELTLGTFAGMFKTLNLLEIFTFKEALAFLAFYTLYTPCLATLASIKAECGAELAVKSFLWSLFVALSVSFLILLIL